jgi:protoheme IX farnesyltransferase
MSGLIYLAGAVVLNVVFLYYAVRMQFDESDALAWKTFKYSIVYLTLLFVALFVDHYWPLVRVALA